MDFGVALGGVKGASLRPISTTLLFILLEAIEPVNYSHCLFGHLPCQQLVITLET
jgi:hypothetical protein